MALGFGLDHNVESPRPRAVGFGVEHQVVFSLVQLMKPKELAQSNPVGEGIKAGHFDPGALSADTVGRAVMADGFFDAATAAAKIGAGAIPDAKLTNGANLPSASEKAAMAGTNGAPSGANKFVTDSDPRLGGGGGGGAFDINTIPKVVWFQADVGTYTDNGFGTPATADGTGVGGWRDQGDNGLDASTAGTKPVLKTNIVNGKPVLRFASAQLDTTKNVYLPSNEVNFFFVCARPWASVNGVFRALLGEGNGSVFAIYLADTNAGDWFTNPIAYGGGSGAGVEPRVVGSNAGLADNSFHVFGVKLGAFSEWRVDGVAKSSLRLSGPNTVATQPLHIGQEGSGSFFDGDLAELLIVPGNLDKAVFNNIEKYLGTKYNIPVT